MQLYSLKKKAVSTEIPKSMTSLPDHSDMSELYIQRENQGTSVRKEVIHTKTVIQNTHEMQTTLQRQEVTWSHNVWITERDVGCLLL